MDITFYKENLLNGEHLVNSKRIARDFVDSEKYRFYTSGTPLERALLVFMSETYGSFERLSDDQIHVLSQEVKLREKKIKGLNGDDEIIFL